MEEGDEPFRYAQEEDRSYSPLLPYAGQIQVMEIHSLG